MTDINVCKCIRCEMLKFQTELELCIIIDAKMIVDDKGENPKEKKTPYDRFDVLLRAEAVGNTY